MQNARWFQFFLVFGLGLTTASLTANTLGPGGSGTPDAFSLGYSSSPPNGQPRHVIVNLSGTWGTASFGGRFYEQVESDPANVFCSGCLDFLFQVSNDSTQNITRVTESGFEFGLSTYQTDIGYDSRSLGDLILCGIDDGGFCNNGDPNTVPTSVDRSSAGDVMGFNFSVGAGPNESTVDLVIETNALSYIDPVATVYGSKGDTGTASIYGPSGSPVSGVPEPSSVLLFGTGLLLLTCLLRRKLSR